MEDTEEMMGGDDGASAHDVYTQLQHRDEWQEMERSFVIKEVEKRGSQL